MHKALESTEPMMPVPWLDLVRFHMEIVRRAEEGLFSLAPATAERSHWSYLDGFEPGLLSGPWPLSAGTIRSKALEFELVGNPAPKAMFLGGPCYPGFLKNEDPKGPKWIPCWRPIFYREVLVDVDLDGDGGWSVTPDAGAWSISPLVLKLLDGKGMALEDPQEQLCRIVLERAAQLALARAGNLSAAVLEALLEKAPALETELTKAPDFHPAPTPWVLFSPPGTASPVIAHLMRDYEELEQRLSADPSATGGLGLLEGSLPGLVPGPVADVLQFVPLNDAQKRAVRGILGADPLTVVSGPPGCGKSQVVMSVILNAWKQGKTVLFASNNNKAVDVVYERLARFETEIPVAVRAGARKYNQVLKNLSDIEAAAGKLGLGSADGVGGAAKLEAERAAVRELLDSGLPKRISDAWRTALSSRASALKQRKLLREREEQLRSEHRNAGFTGFPVEEAGPLALEFRCWLEEAKALESQAAANELLAQERREAAERCRRERDGACSALGLDPSGLSDWAWLLEETFPNLLGDWEKRLRTYISGLQEKVLAEVPWQGTFSDWSSAPRAMEWAEQAEKLRTEIVSVIGDLQPAAERTAALDRELAAATDVLEASASARSPNLNPDLGETLSKWAAARAEEITTPSRTFDFLPWSTSSRRRRELDSLERQMRPAFPLATWSRVGALDGAGRAKLSVIVEAARAWLSAYSRWESAERERSQIKAAVAHLRGKLAGLGIKDGPAGPEEVGWFPLAEALGVRAGCARAAAEAYEKTKLRDAATAAFRDFRAEFVEIAAGDRLASTWARRDGRLLGDLLENLAEAPEPRLVPELRRTLAAAPIEAVLTGWRTASDAHKARLESRRAVETIRLRPALLREWWKGRPTVVLPPNLPEPEAFPDQEGFLPDLLSRLKNSADAWSSFAGSDRPERDREIAGWESRARENLGEALVLALSKAPNPKLTTLAFKLKAGDEAAWDVGTVFQAFQALNDRWLRARLEGIEGQLEALAFAEAKREWKERATANGAAPLQALSTLKSLYLKQNLTLQDGQVETFRAALPAAPVWVATAQASRSIPLAPALFDLVVIDEASQCTLTNLIPLLYRARRLAVIGDGNQLPAVPNVTAPDENGLASKHGVAALLPRYGHCANDVYRAASYALPLGPADVVWLVEHFRSHPLIVGFSNRHIYQRKLILRRDPVTAKVIPAGWGVHARHVTGVATKGPSGRSWKNEEEAKAVVALVAELSPGAGGPSIGVVTPFLPQEELIQKLLGEAGIVHADVGTAHKFQGDERDIIVFSPVAAKGLPEASHRFIQDPPNLLNVAITRAREALFLVGDMDHLRSVRGLLGEFARYALLIEELRRTSQAELELFGWMTMRNLYPECQVQVGDIRVDFVLAGKGTRLAVEVDGDLTPAKDDARDAFLLAKGYQPLHFATIDVYEKPESVLQTIESALAGEVVP